MAEKYLLVNPIIIGGGSNLSFEGHTPNEAAQNAWDSISQNIINLLPKSYFTLQNENDKLFHFKVMEKISKSKQSGGGTLKYSISQYDLELPKNIQRLFLEKVKNIMDQRSIINSMNDDTQMNDDDLIDQDGGSSNDNDSSDNKYKKHNYKGKRPHKKHHKNDDDDEDDSDSDSDEKFLTKLYKKWKQERFLSYIEPAVFYWWYTPTIYKISSLYTPIPNTVLYYNDITPYYKQVFLTS